MATARPPVEGAIPPKLVLRTINPLMRALLRSPLHRLASGRVVLLSVTGHKSGRTYTIPVGRHESDGGLIVCADGTWRINLRGGAPVKVTLDGHERDGYAELEEDPETVARTYLEVLSALGTGKARELGLKLNVDRLPTIEELKPVLAGRGVARVRLS